MNLMFKVFNNPVHEPVQSVTDTFNFYRYITVAIDAVCNNLKSAPECGKEVMYAFIDKRLN